MIALADRPRRVARAGIVGVGSFTAARVLGLSKASLSEHFRKLEVSRAIASEAPIYFRGLAAGPGASAWTQSRGGAEGGGR